MVDALGMSRKRKEYIIRRAIIENEVHENQMTMISRKSILIFLQRGCSRYMYDGGATAEEYGAINRGQQGTIY